MESFNNIPKSILFILINGAIVPIKEIVIDTKKTIINDMGKYGIRLNLRFITSSLFNRSFIMFMDITPKMTLVIEDNIVIHRL